MWVKTLPFLVGNVDNYQYKNYNLWQNLIHMRMSCVEKPLDAVYYG